MTSQVRRRTFTTNHRRGNAGSPTPSHTTKTRAGPSASLGDDPSSLPLDTPLFLIPCTPQPPPAHRQTVNYTIQTPHLLSGSERFRTDSWYKLLGNNHSNRGQVPEVVFSYFWGHSISCCLVLKAQSPSFHLRAHVQFPYSSFATRRHSSKQQRKTGSRFKTGNKQIKSRLASSLQVPN